MAELSVEELSRLTRNFLVGRGGEAELEDTKRTMEADPQLAMEFLQQMQTALDEVAPAGFNPEQWAQIDSRITTVMAPLIKSGGLGFVGKLFGKLFKKNRSADGASRIKRKGAPPEIPSRPVPSESPVSLVSAEPVVAPASSMPGEVMEEMAPIAPSPPPMLPEELPREAPQRREPEAAPAVAGSSRVWTRVLAFLALVLILVGLAFWKGQGILNWARALKKPAPAPALAVLPVPTVRPTVNTGPPHRAQPPSTQDEPLPSELPPMTPQAAGNVNAVGGLEAKDPEGHTGLPLP